MGDIYNAYVFQITFKDCLVYAQKYYPSEDSIILVNSIFYIGINFSKTSSLHLNI